MTRLGPIVCSKNVDQATIEAVLQDIYNFENGLITFGEFNKHGMNFMAFKLDYGCVNVHYETGLSVETELYFYIYFI